MDAQKTMPTSRIALLLRELLELDEVIDGIAR
jgi:hypothetical protein